MTNLKYLQKLFFLLVMGFSLSFICACGDDEEDEPVQNPNEEITNPTDSIPSEDEPTVPNDSITTNPTDRIPSYEAVDLGLSVKWATCNVGANAPEEYGGYYAWGETEEKSDYTEYTYKYYNENTGYVNIGSNISGTQYDVAHVKWGGSWRMPTKDEIEELYDECTWEWTTLNGVNGKLVTGPNGNSIFLPAAGYRNGTELVNAGEYGGNWSATLVEDSSGNAFSRSFYSYGAYLSGGSARFCGRSVRPVTE